ncbi:MAG: sulfite exporter TauE/SafE family protein [Candidatus Moduliflexus flocculans]|nr:sulfite exporter TauE/SafE family protein [Candidatus Moduliflexus flocculans]
MGMGDLPLVVAVIFASAFIRSAIGFGDAVVAMPLLAMVVGLKTASPLVAFMGPTISLMILAGSWRRIELRSAGRLIVASLLGIPVGIYGLARLPERPLKVVLGLLILLYGIFGLMKPKARISDEKPWVPWFVGWIAGVLGGAYSTNGPPVVAYGMLKGWPPEDFRATLSGLLPADRLDGPRGSRPGRDVDFGGLVVLYVVAARHRSRRDPGRPAEQEDPPRAFRPFG